jgi:hypothetical protein
VTQFPDVRPRLTPQSQQRPPFFQFQDGEIVYLADAESALDRTFFRWFLIEPSLERFDGRLEIPRRRAVQFHHRHVLLDTFVEDLGTPGRVTEQQRERAGDFGIERPRVSDPADLGGTRRSEAVVDGVADPGSDLVGGGTGWFVEVDNPECEPVGRRPLVRRIAHPDHPKSYSTPVTGILPSSPEGS